MSKTYDYIIIGSGFGGSVSALRLAEKGYSVLVIEQGKRYQTEDFPKTNWNLRKYFWMPKLALIWHSGNDFIERCVHFAWNRCWRRKSCIC